MQIFKKKEARPKFTGSYKKKVCNSHEMSVTFVLLCLVIVGSSGSDQSVLDPIQTRLSWCHSDWGRMGSKNPHQ